MKAVDHTGGPAFPLLQDGFQFPRAEGMTLRDYFAAHVIPPQDIGRCWGEIMVRPYPKSEDGMTDAPYGRAVIEWWQAVDAAWRYAQADAMLAAREGGAA